MARNRNVPELLERFMEESGETQRWVTVNEVRTYFHLDAFAAPAISGFLQRIYQDPSFACPYRVERIEKVTVEKPKHRIIKRYFVTMRPHACQKRPADISTRFNGTPTHGIFTDSAAIEHFNQVLLKNSDENGS
jgi:hypothetical protein